MNGCNLPLVDGTCSFYREFDVGLLVWDLSPSWVILVVNEENEICGTKCMEFLPCIKQCVVFCLCRTFGKFLCRIYQVVEFTKYNFIVHGYGRLDKLVHEELSSLYTRLSTDKRLCMFSFLDDLIWTWLNYGRQHKDE